MTAPGPERDKPTTPLNDGEQRAFSDIERGLRREDPDLSAVLADLVDLRERRHRLARGLVGIGLLVAFIGLVAQDGVVSLGAIVLAYGLLSVTTGGVLLLSHHFRPLS